MKTTQLIEQLFGGANVACRDMSVDYGTLAGADTLLPFLCLQIEKVGAGTDEENKIIKCSYIKTEESLMFLQVENFELLNVDRAGAIINDFTDTALGKNFIERLPSGDYDITNIVVHFRQELQNIEDNKSISADALFELISEVVFTPGSGFNLVNDESKLNTLKKKEEKVNDEPKSSFRENDKKRLLKASRHNIRTEFPKSNKPFDLSSVLSEQNS
ncbi:hypothetical protein H4J64_11655, partial [Colwellia sp. BRX8-2]